MPSQAKPRLRQQAGTEKDMKDDKTISASEINRYLYCNYQWYYERKYGAAELRRRKKAYMEEMGITSSSGENSPFQRGLIFHANFGRYRYLKLTYKLFRAAALAAIFIYLLLSGGIIVS